MQQPVKLVLDTLTRSRMSYRAMIVIIYGICKGDKDTVIADESGVHRNKVISVRDEIIHSIEMWLTLDANGYMELVLGGHNITVEIDEAQLGRRKHNRGAPRREQWCIGMIERGSNRLTIIPVARRTTEEMLDLILKHVLPGTEVCTDKWRSYNALCENNYYHRTVNHSVTFVSPEGVHTNTIEGCWKHARQSLRNRFKLNKSLWWFMFTRTLGDRTPGSVFQHLFEILKAPVLD